jgi:hypothetical protein
VAGTYPPGQGEPLNIIISGNSDAAVLVDQATNGGLQNFFQSFGFGGECLGQHMGSDQAANLGDGHNYVNETAEMRWDYGDPQFGTCKESIQGGDHFRYWTQNGPDGNRLVSHHFLFYAGTVIFALLFLIQRRYFHGIFI